MPQPPQWAGLLARAVSHPSVGTRLQSANPMLQAKPQVSRWHVGAALATTGQTTHVGPQASGSVATAHLSPHLWYPALQSTPQRPATHVVVALSTTGHALSQPPQ